MRYIKIKQEKLCLYLLLLANVCYGIAMFTHCWFSLPGVSYGLWWAVFCDVLSCQIVPAFFTEEPVWYHIVQLLSLAGWTGLALALLAIYKHVHFIHSLISHQTVAIICIVSGFMISSSLMIFYGKLDESSTSAVPKIHWSAMLAGVACVLQFITGLVLV